MVPAEIVIDPCTGGFLRETVQQVAAVLEHRVEPLQHVNRPSAMARRRRPRKKVPDLALVRPRVFHLVALAVAPDIQMPGLEHRPLRGMGADVRQKIQRGPILRNRTSRKHGQIAQVPLQRLAGRYRAAVQHHVMGA